MYLFEALTFKPHHGPSLVELPLTKFTSAWQGHMSQHGESPLETSQQKVGVYQIEFNVDVGRTGFYCSVITSRHYIERNYPATTHLKLLPFYSYKYRYREIKFLGVKARRSP